MIIPLQRQGVTRSVNRVALSERLSSLELSGCSDFKKVACGGALIACGGVCVASAGLACAQCFAALGMGSCMDCL
jgi:hypothetical protein